MDTSKDRPHAGFVIDRACCLADENRLALRLRFANVRCSLRHCSVAPMIKPTISQYKLAGVENNATLSWVRAMPIRLKHSARARRTHRVGLAAQTALPAKSRTAINVEIHMIRPIRPYLSKITRKLLSIERWKPTNSSGVSNPWPHHQCPGMTEYTR